MVLPLFKVSLFTVWFGDWKLLKAVLVAVGLPCDGFTLTLWALGDVRLGSLLFRSWPKSCGKLSKLELDKMLTDENLNIDKYTVVLDNKEDKSSSQSIGVYDFDRKLVNSDNLPKVMEDYYNQWEKENDKK